MATIEPKIVTLKNGQEACIRTATEEDVEQILDYTQAMFQDDRYFLLTAEEAKEQWTVENSRERIISAADDANAISVVTEIQNQVVSLAHVKCRVKLRNRHVGKTGIGVLPEYRGAGLGAAIMQVMIDWAQNNPVIEKLFLEVWDFNDRAFGLYEKMGFIVEGRRIREAKFGPGDYADEILMYKDVRTGASEDGSN